jgi:hypothetical protein
MLPFQTEVQYFNYAPKGSRTPNLLIRSQTLYPVELWVLKKVPRQIYYLLCTSPHLCCPFTMALHNVSKQCRGPESNRYGDHSPQDFKSCASASSATPARIGKAENGVRTRDPHLGKVVLYH